MKKFLAMSDVSQVSVVSRTNSGVARIWIYYGLFRVCRGSICSETPV